MFNYIFGLNKKNLEECFKTMNNSSANNNHVCMNKDIEIKKLENADSDRFKIDSIYGKDKNNLYFLNKKLNEKFTNFK